MKKIFFLSLLFISGIPVFAQNIQRSSPTTDDLMLRKELENDKTILQITCGLFTEVDEKNMNAAEMIKSQKENSRIKLLLYQASKTKNETSKAKYTCATGGGVETVNYLTVQNGSARFIEDLTRDASGGFRINRMTCKNLQIGYLAKNKSDTSYKFMQFKNENYGDKIIVLQCKTAERTFLF